MTSALFHKCRLLKCQIFSFFWFLFIIWNKTHFIERSVSFGKQLCCAQQTASPISFFIIILGIVERKCYTVYYRVDLFCIFCNLGSDNLDFLSFPQWHVKILHVSWKWFPFVYNYMAITLHGMSALHCKMQQRIQPASVYCCGFAHKRIAEESGCCSHIVLPGFV